MNAILSALLIFTSTMVYGFIHSVLASLQAKGYVDMRFGQWGKRSYRLAYNIFAAITLLPILALPVALPDIPIYRIQYPWILLTTFGQLMAALALGIGVIQTGAGSFLGLEQLFEPPGMESPKLVISGLYKWVRHPLYTAGLVFIWLTPLMSTNLLALFAGFSIYLGVGALFEEKKLVLEYGEPYLEYKKRVPMIIPRPPQKNQPQS